ncbi:tryptophanyl-tRNA synthetase [Prauserella sediminis]|uniref:Tryptophan--tRNA ligase n=1 Tax=Prauserella sediminis TaxID=577680 RepID=A0A839XM22_9PSEU|nr:tryptophan--tRNA ligase [Prauserella sediminis]MBB3662879.1 tryptophanyl-tRNA synthetase [Prauserella sediminis]
MSHPSRPRLLTGDRPTGRLHLGHYVGSLANRVRLAREYETFLILADLHLLTTENSPDAIARIPQHVREQVLDALAVGVDPERVTFYLQSAIGEVAELNTLLQSLVSVSRLQRIPSLKDMSLGGEMGYALLGYPVLQAADILCVKAGAVPVGQDNNAHVEVTREIARRFNGLYGEVFPVPAAVTSDVPSLIGTDGQAKMSKSLGNAIYLSDPPEDVDRKVARMYTDPQRVRADVPGTVEGNPVFEYHRAFNDDRAEVADLEERYREGRVGDVEVKQALAAALNRFLDPVRERRAEYAARSGYVDELITSGTERTRTVVREVVFEARRAMGLTGAYNRLRRKAARSATR